MYICVAFILLYNACIAFTFAHKCILQVIKTTIACTNASVCYGCTFVISPSHTKNSSIINNEIHTVERIQNISMYAQGNVKLYALRISWGLNYQQFTKRKVKKTAKHWQKKVHTIAIHIMKWHMLLIYLHSKWNCAQKYPLFYGYMQFWLFLVYDLNSSRKQTKHIERKMSL